MIRRDADLSCTAQSRRKARMAWRSRDTPIYLDAQLVDTPLIGGLSPMLGGTQHIRTLTVLGFPNHDPTWLARRASTISTSATAG